MIEVYFGFSDTCFLVAGIVSDILVSQEYARRDIYGSPEECPDSSDELIRNKRLGQIVIGTDIESVDDLLTISIPRYDQDGCSTSFL